MLTGIVEIFQIKRFDEKLQIFLLDWKELLNGTEEAQTAFRLQVAAAPKRSMDGSDAQKLVSLLAVMGDLLLREAGTEQIRQAEKSVHDGANQRRL